MELILINYFPSYPILFIVFIYFKCIERSRSIKIMKLSQLTLNKSFTIEDRKLIIEDSPNV